MAKKGSTRFVCSECGASYASWSGRCAQCGNWNTLQESLANAAETLRSTGSQLSAQSVDAIAKADTVRRILTGMSDVDVVLGGGFVPGGVVLLPENLASEKARCYCRFRRPWQSKVRCSM